MNCEQFHVRMQAALDVRSEPGDDPQLTAHAASCADCRGQLNTWRLIESAICSEGLASPPSTSASSRSAIKQFAPVVLAAVAATVLIAVTFLDRNRSQVTEPLVFANSSISEQQAADLEDALRVAQWWDSVRRRDWIAQTMPTVRSVQAGVAPLGKSLLQAVTILTVGNRSQAS